jgi:glycosyltransferase involved in cell wall biosynthesis
MINITQDEIMSNWDNKDSYIPLVSICCITYNHSNYIEQCLDGFLMQKTSFPFEIIIHDDCSTDGTTEIIKKYVDKYPKIFVTFYEDENQYSKGVRGIYVNYVFPYIKGQFVAMCEGDDYWIDSGKLERQIQYLMKSPATTLLAENTRVENSIKNTSYLFSSETTESFSLEQILYKRRFATSSVIFRFSVLKDFLPRLKTSCDTIIWACCASVGRIDYIPNVSSVYRRGLQGVTENTNKYLWALKNEEWTKQIYELFVPEKIKNHSLDFGLFKAFLVAFLDKKKQKQDVCNIAKKIFVYYRFGYIIRLFLEKYGNKISKK